VTETDLDDVLIENGIDLGPEVEELADMPLPYLPPNRTYALDIPLITACTLSGLSTIKLKCVFDVLGRE